MRPAVLLIDLDGVLRRWPQDYKALEAEHGLPAGALGRVAFEATLLEQVVTGAITDRQWRRLVSDRLASVYPSSRAAEAVLAWSESAGTVDQEVLRLVIQARKHCVVGLLTNATDRLPRDLESLGLTKYFDFIINSSAVGYCKPSPEIFKYATSRVGVLASDTVFVDDSPANVTAASALGMRALCFTSVAGMRAFMLANQMLTNAT